MYRNGLILMVMLFVFLFSYGQKTAVKPVSKTPQFIMHVVKFGETLTKIAKNYNVSVVAILNVNPSLTQDNLNPEQILRIPNTSKKQILISSETTNSELKPKVQVSKELNLKSGKYHMVLSGETMYHISKLYDIKVEDIQKWNDIKDFNLKVGSLIIVSDPSKTQTNPSNLEVPSINPVERENKIPVKTAEIQTEKSKDQILTPDKQDVSDVETENPDIQANNNESQQVLVKLFKERAAKGNMKTTKGTGAPMTTTLGAMEKVYFVMHKTLPIGTIMKIKNLVNSKIIFAKVIGKLPETDENKHVIVRYSLGVKKDLLLQNGKCYVQIEYPD